MGLEKTEIVSILGIIIPYEMTLGAALEEIEGLRSEMKKTLMANGSLLSEPVTLCVTRRAEICNALCDKSNVMLVDLDELTCDFKYLQRRVWVNKDPARDHWDDIKDLDELPVL